MNRSATRILSAHTPALFEAAVDRAAAMLRSGGLVALPTETVYGLAANALDAAAVARIYEAKGRPTHNPIIVHVASLEQARRCVADWPPAAERLAAAFWPGPLTLVLPKSTVIPDVVTAGGPTVGIRWPRHPMMQAVIRECGFPIAAPSANLANQLSPTTAEHVRKALGGRIPLIVDGGPAQVGIESTVLDLTTDPPRVLRPGMIHVESLRAALDARVASTDEADQPAGRKRRGVNNGIEARPVGQPEARRRRVGRSQSTGVPLEPAGGEALRSPGQLPRHYAPRARLVVLRWNDEADLRRRLRALGVAPAGCQVVAYAQVPSPAGWSGVSVVPHDAEAYARALYAELHRCDDAGAAVIVIEAPPEEAVWAGIADRLRRASAPGENQAPL